MRIIYTFLLSLMLLGQSEASHPALIQAEFVFSAPPTPSCHSATLTETPSGDLLCAWFGGLQEGEKDVAIWLSTLHASQWNPPQKVASEQDIPCWNPVLFTMPSGEILLFYKAGKTPREWSGFLKRSFDHGKSWSAEECFPAGIVGPEKNKPLLLKNGTLLCGSARESYKRWGSWIDITPDAGRTWSKSGPINVPEQLFGIIQPTLFFGKADEVRMLTRSHQIGHICTAVSQDEGRTWSEARPTALPNPNAGIDAVRLQDGRILLVYNHSLTERTPLNIALSENNGETWTNTITLENAPGEYSYPSVIQDAKGLVHIVYTWKREYIKHVVIDPLLID